MKYIEEFTAPSKIHEQIFVGYMWNTPQLYERYKTHKIMKETFTEDIWYFYFRIGKEMYDSGIRTFDDITVYSYLTSRPKEEKKKSWFDFYDGYGGYETIKEMMEECANDKKNDEYHFSEIQKYESLRFFQKHSMLDPKDKQLIQKLVNMNLKQMQMYFQYKAKEAFSHINTGEVMVYQLIDDLDGTIKKLNEGEALGLPLYEAPRLTKKLKGWKDGTLSYLVLSSGVGKTSFGIEKYIVSIIEGDEKGLLFANEEGVFKFRTLLLATVASRILGTPVNREKLSEGNFNEEQLKRLNDAKDWLYKHKRDAVLFIELKKYRIQDVISHIELYRPLGYSKVFFDTFKPDLTRGDTSRWEAFSNSAQELHDCIKKESNNCATLATVQLKIGKEYRYLDLSTIGKSLEIVEVAHAVLIGRMLYDDEYEDGKNELHPYNYHWDELKEEWVKAKYKLDPNKQYMILFIAKNRDGGKDEQIVYEVSYGINAWREVAYCIVPKTSSIM